MLTRRLVLALSLSAVPLAAAAPRAAGEEPQCNRWDLEVVCETQPSRVIVGDPFKATVTAKNTGDKTLANVTLSLRGDLGARCVDGGQTEVKTLIEKLEPGEAKQISADFVSDTVGSARVIGGAGDALRWAAANCACIVDIIGLPAIQSEMVDKDVQGNEKGIFVVNETFTYVLSVENDVGSTVTPDLNVVFALPQELEFVSGKMDNGGTVTGAGQSATSSSFVLAPNKVQRIELTVKVVASPPSNLVQTRATIQTAGGVAVAEETESTTLKQ